MTRLKIAVLFDGAGLARLGLERAGHTCVGVELDPAKHHLSRMIGSGNCVLGDVRDFDLSGFDAVWASPPCQPFSDMRVHKAAGEFADAGLLEWALNINTPVLWVENVIPQRNTDLNSDRWGRFYNAAQFLDLPIQKRRRQIGGRYNEPLIYREFQHDYPKMDVCPAIMAGERNGSGFAVDPTKERRKATRWYGRPLSIREMAYHQGLIVPDDLLKSWLQTPPLINPKTGKLYTQTQWTYVLSSAIGNGVPVYMAQAFGAAYTGDYPRCEDYAAR